MAVHEYITDAVHVLLDQDASLNDRREAAQKLQRLGEPHEQFNKMWVLYPDGAPDSKYVGDNIEEMIKEVGALKDANDGDKWIIEVRLFSDAEMFAMGEFDGF